MTCLHSSLARYFAFCVLAMALLAAGAAAQVTPSPSPTLEQELGAEVDRYVKADQVARPAPCQVLFVGSSSIVNWRDSLAADMAPMPVINRGFGGSHIEYVNRWFDQIVAPYRPRAIVFYAGENDIDAGKSVDRVVGDFAAFMERKTRVLGKTPVYFISLKPSKLRFAQLPLQSQVNAAIRTRAGERRDLHYIDVVSAMLENGKPKDIFRPDGLHMTPEGYLIWIGVVRAALLPNTEAEARSCHHTKPR
jgi:lysophospholipase L1-like esterase